MLEFRAPGDPGLRGPVLSRKLLVGIRRRLHPQREGGDCTGSEKGSNWDPGGTRNASRVSVLSDTVPEAERLSGSYRYTSGD